MNQQINLYQIASGPVGYWTLPRIGQYLGGALLLLTLISLANWWELSRVKRAVIELEAQREELAASIEERKQSTVAPQVAGLQEQLKRLKSEQDRYKQIIERLKQGGFGNQVGFSPLLNAFAQSRIYGLWLTDIRFAAGGQKLTLGGYAQEESLVPKLVSRMGDQEALTKLGLLFQHIELRRTSEATAAAPIVFEISTDAASASSETGALRQAIDAAQRSAEGPGATP